MVAVEDQDPLTSFLAEEVQEVLLSFREEDDEDQMVHKVLL